MTDPGKALPDASAAAKNGTRHGRIPPNHFNR